MFLINSRFVLSITLLLFFLVGCGGGSSGSASNGTDGDGDNSGDVDNGTTVNLSDGGTFTLDDSVVLRVQSGGGQGDINLSVSAANEPGEVVDVSTVVSREYILESSGLKRGDLTIPVLVSLPVSTDLLPDDPDPMAFDVQVYNEATEQWDWVDGWAFYDDETQDVSFWTGHFSKYRVLHSEPNDREGYERFRANSRNFSVIYYEPISPVFGKEYKYAVPSDAAWSALGSGTYVDADIPDYVEDLDNVLEESLTYYLGITASDGSKLFSEPADRVDAYVTYLPKADAAGDSKFGIMRIASSLDNYADIRSTATHELAHVVSGQYYNVFGAAANRWFYEAIADLWTSRALGLSRAEQITFFSKLKYNYLRVSLDASDEGSYYAAADFLHWLEQTTGKAIAADVVKADYTSDLSALNALLSDDTTTLSDYYVEYALQAAAGDHDFNAPLFEQPNKISQTEAGVYQLIELKHLSATGFNFKGDWDVDGMLVVSSDRLGDAGSLKTFTYEASGLPVGDISDYMEVFAEDSAPFVFKHFGKAGTSGISASSVFQFVINDSVADAEDQSYLLDVYLLVPPRTQVSEGRVDIAYDAIYATNQQPLTGYNVYLNGQKLNGFLVEPTEDVFTHSSIHDDSDILVTAVDRYGNEWPEQPGLDATTWEMLVDVSPASADIARCENSHVSVSNVNGAWVPVEVDSDGNVSFNYDWVGTYGTDPQLHIEGTGTFIDDELQVSGSWTRDENIPMVLGVSEGYVSANRGTFSDSGKFLLGIFLPSRNSESATAEASYTRYRYSWDGEQYVADEPEHSTCTDQHPRVDITEFRQK